MILSIVDRELSCESTPKGTQQTRSNTARAS